MLKPALRWQGVGAIKSREGQELSIASESWEILGEVVKNIILWLIMGDHRHMNVISLTPTSRNIEIYRNVHRTRHQKAVNRLCGPIQLLHVSPSRMVLEEHHKLLQKEMLGRRISNCLQNTWLLWLEKKHVYYRHKKLLDMIGRTSFQLIIQVKWWRWFELRLHQSEPVKNVRNARSNIVEVCLR